MSIFSWFGGGKAAAVAAEHASPPASTGSYRSVQGNSDLEWDMRGPDAEMRPDNDDAMLMHGDDCLAGVSEYREGKATFAKIETFGLDRGGLQERYATLHDGMAATEGWAVEQGLKLLEQRKQVDALNDPMAFFRRPEVEQLAEASEAFHARAAGELEPSQVKDTASFLAAHPPVIEEFAAASESYYASLTALAERRGAEMDRDASERDFGLDL